jgi:DNA-binding transcriptional MerR regulator
MTETEEFAINELAKKSGVSVRTIRFYINEGLLPAPQIQGRYTVYTQEYLDRLALIRHLKESFLPLKEIRDVLSSLSWDEVRETLAQVSRRNVVYAPPPSAEREPDRARTLREDRSSALDYINSLLSSTPATRPLPPSQQPEPLRPAPSPPKREAWERVALSDRLELHIRQPLRKDEIKKIEELISFVKKLFSE